MKKRSSLYLRGMSFFQKKQQSKPILIIQGSLSPHSKSHVLVENVADKLHTRNASFDIVDLRTSDIDFFTGNPISTYNAKTQAVYAALHAAKGYVVSAPVYGGKISGGIRNFIDIMNDALRGKLAGIMCHAKEGNAYPASVELKELLFSKASMRTVQPIVLTSDDAFKQDSLYDEVILDVMEEMLYSLLKQMS